MGRFVRWGLWGAGVLALACDAPDHAFSMACRHTVLEPVECRFRQDVVTKNQTAVVDPRTKNFLVHVRGTFSIERGKAAVVVLGCAERGRIDVEHRGAGRSAPVSLDCVSEVDRNTFLVPVDTFAIGGDAHGLEGTLVFTPR